MNTSGSSTPVENSVIRDAFVAKVLQYAIRVICPRSDTRQGKQVGDNYPHTALRPHPARPPPCLYPLGFPSRGPRLGPTARVWLDLPTAGPPLPPQYAGHCAGQRSRALRFYYTAF